MSEETTKRGRGRPQGSKDKPKLVVTTNENGEIAEQYVKNKRVRPDRANLGADNVNPGDNSAFLRYALVAYDLPPIDISDPEQVEQRIREYFTFCLENDRKPNIKGLGNWLGVDRNTVHSWMHGEYRAATHTKIIRRAVDLLEELWVDYMMNGKVNPASGIFLGKNMFGYRDVQDVVVTPNNPLGDAEQAPALAQKYVDAIEQDGEEYLLPGDAPVNAQNGSVGVLEGEAEKIYTE